VASFILFLLYLLLILLETTLFYRIQDEALGLSFKEVLVDVVIVNMVSLVLIVFLFGIQIARLDATGTSTHFFRTMMITWPQEIIKVSLFSIVSDAVILAGWYAYRYPRLNILTTAARGALMNVPALIVAGSAWIFMTIVYEFFRFLRIV